MYSDYTLEFQILILRVPDFYNNLLPAVNVSQYLKVRVSYLRAY